MFSPATCLPIIIMLLPTSIAARLVCARLMCAGFRVQEAEAQVRHLKAESATLKTLLMKFHAASSPIGTRFRCLYELAMVMRGERMECEREEKEKEVSKERLATHPCMRSRIRNRRVQRDSCAR